MKTKEFIRLISLVLLLGLTTSVWAKKKAFLRFYPMGTDLIVTVNQNDDQTANDFFYIQLSAPIGKKLLKDGMYSLFIRKDFIIMEGKEHSLGFTVNPEIIQTAFRQKVKYVYAIGIVEGHSDTPISVNQVLKQYQTEAAQLHPATFERKGHLKTCRTGYQLYCTEDGLWCRCIKEEEDQL